MNSDNEYHILLYQVILLAVDPASPPITYHVETRRDKQSFVTRPQAVPVLHQGPAVLYVPAAAAAATILALLRQTLFPGASLETKLLHIRQGRAWGMPGGKKNETSRVYHF